MKTRSLFLMLLAVAGIIFSCNDEDKFTPFLQADHLSGSFTVNEESRDTFIMISSNVAWTATTDASWITLNQKSGEAAENYKFKFHVDENSELTNRPGKIVITAKEFPATQLTIQITQEGIKIIPEIRITSPEDKIFNLEIPDESEQTFSITANVAWKVSSTASWITIVTTEGSGNGDIKFKADANTGEKRDGSITVSYARNEEVKDILTVNQARFVSPQETDSLAMLAILNNITFDSPYYGRNWKADKPIKEWNYVTVENGRVTAIDFMGQVTGSLTLPQEIGNLTELRKLNLSYFNASGELPGTLGNLKKLEILVLDNNNFTGEFPSTLAQLTALTEFTLTKNKITGCIPAALAKFESTINPQKGKTWRDEYNLEICK